MTSDSIAAATQRENTLIEDQIDAIVPTASVEQIAEAYTRVDGLMRRARDFQKQLEDRCIAWLKANRDKNICWATDDSGAEMVLYLGHTRVTKCPDVRKTLQTLVELRGDWDAAVNCLSAGAIKHGAAKKYLAECGKPELFDQLFVVEVRDKLADGSPKPKEIQKFDSRFIR